MVRTVLSEYNRILHFDLFRIQHDFVGRTSDFGIDFQQTLVSP